MKTVTAEPSTARSGGERDGPPSERRRWFSHPSLWLAFAAIVLRLVVFTARGDYIAFDEGWYLVLGRSVIDGDGYSLTGLRHTTLSPLFPLLAGLAGRMLGDVLWGGRLVAAVTAGLLVFPCWHLFRRLADARVAFIGCLLIAVMPSLAPFAAPFWIEWDLWVGAEPVLHLFMYSALALVLRARDRGRTVDWLLAGACFGLAYLARPESIVVFGIAGSAVGVASLVRRDSRRIVGAILMALAFAATATPYWLYLHDTLGRWALSGRVVELAPSRAPTGSTSAARSAASSGAATGIERMLWQDDNTPYVRVLYGLDETGTRLGSTYWGVAVQDAASDSAGTLMDAAEAPALPVTIPATESRVMTQDLPEPPGRWELYMRALGIVVPWFVWPFVLIGLIGRRTAPSDELLVMLPLLITSFAVARLVGVDPRTQLFVVPAAAFYAARGIGLLAPVADRRLAGTSVRPGFITHAATIVVMCALLATIGRWVYLGWSIGSPHHAVGAANRAAGAALNEIVPPTEPVMTWHPAHAIYAGREWRVLPWATLPEIVRYANATGCEYILLSAYYPGSQLMRGIPRDHMVLEVPPDAPDAVDGWAIEITRVADAFVHGRLVYDSDRSPDAF